MKESGGAEIGGVVLKVDDVVKSYGEVKALRGVSLEVRSGEFVALLGPNGAGKSTLLQLLTGLFSPDAGRVEVLGHDIARDATRALAGIGVVFQQQTLDLELSVKANLLYHADLHGISRKVARQRVAEGMAHYGLKPKDRVRALSGGNRRRVELARALVHRPKVLLMDEATVGLDPNSRRDLLEEMTRLKTEEHLGILWTTHLIDEIENADRIIMLDRGRVLYEGTTKALLEQSGSNDLAATLMSMMEKDESAPVLARKSPGLLGP